MDTDEISPFIESDNDSRDEFIVEESDSDFGLQPRRKVGPPMSFKRKGLCMCIIVFLVALTVSIFLTGLVIGHYGIPSHFENQATSTSGNPVPTFAPCNTTTTPPLSLAEEICQDPPLLLISLDGFRASYFERNLTPFMDSLAREGVRASYMRSVYPTITFPNHYSIATGLYPESHGIVHNTFYDTELKKKFYIGSPNGDDSEWWKGEPIWVTATKNGLRSGIYFWPGSEARIQGYRPDYYYRYNTDVPFEERVSTVLQWLDLPKSFRPQFMALYLHEPDHSGHQNGPDSSEVNDVLGLVDQTIKTLFEGLEMRQIKDCVNVLFVSDHGMAAYDSSKLVNLNQYVDTSSLSSSVSTSGTVAYLDTNGGPQVLQEVFDALTTNASDLPLRFYLTQSLPYRLHAGHYNKQRYTEVQLLANVGGYISGRSNSLSIHGEHGYDNINEEMHAIFQAHGPAFKTNYQPEAFDNIQLYSLMCGLLGIPPAPNNGTTGALYHLLTPSEVTHLPPMQVYPPTHLFAKTSVNKCLFSTNETVYESRSFCDECVCSVPGDDVGCEGVSNSTINDANRALDITDTYADMYTETHLPWGVPTPVGPALNFCLLAQQLYVAMYSHQLHIPLWTAYKLTKQQALQDHTSTSCVRRDPRLLPRNSSNCTHYSPHPSYTAQVANVSYSDTTLMPVKMADGLSTIDLEELSTSVLSNYVPQSSKFNAEVWQPLHALLSKWAELYNTVHVIKGVILDSDQGGSRDPTDEYQWWTGGRGGVAVPTAFYMVAVRCLDEGTSPSMCGYDQLDTIGFLFQHPCAPGNPSDTDRRLQLGLTQLRDIERISGLNFFPSLSPEEQNALELRIVSNFWPIA